MVKHHDILEIVVDWAKTRDDIRGVVLVGSHARGEARSNSDIDLVLLADHPEGFRSANWPTIIDWSRAGVQVRNCVDEEYGAVWCRRIWLEPEGELEVGFAPLSWADVSPVDEGTKRVVRDGCRILYDPDGVLQRLTLAIARL